MKKIIDYIVDFIREEYKFLICMILILVIFDFPLNYYITVGGGISDVSSRIDVTDSYKHKGSFNISYVSEAKGTILTYLLSYVIPTWERNSIDDYKYTESDSLEDVEFRGDLDLLTSNGTATFWAYSLANKELTLESRKLYVILTDTKDYITPLKVGDQILSVGGKSFDTVDEYVEYIQTLDVSKKVEVKVIRKGKEKTLSAPIYEVENKKMLGIALQHVNDYTTDPTLNIHFKSSESGPSGGLITTLEIYNQLVKKDITNGLKIAGTGTIEEDGSIGQIGGVTHKVLGAVKGKADVFLVPSGNNYKEAKKYVKEKNLKIKLISVDSIQDALDKLEELA